VHLSMDDPVSLSILTEIERKVITFGLSPNADVKGTNIRREGFAHCFDLISNGDRIKDIKVNLPGKHNVINAIAACSVALELGVDSKSIKEGISKCSGIARRFEKRGFEKGILVVDDYAHHPREIQATLSGAREGWDGRLVAVFQPHLFSRTILLKKEFGKAFFQADKVIITDIYPAREEPIPGVTGEIIKEQCENFGHKDVEYIENKENITKFLLPQLLKGDMVLLLGAGNIYQIAGNILDGIKNKR